MKICSKCKAEKELSEFEKDRTKSDGYFSSCKECKKKANAPRLKAQKEAKAEDRKRFKKILIQSPTKYCGKCKTEKPKEEFHTAASKGDGLVSHCKTCRQEIGQQYYLDNKEAHLNAHRKWITDPQVRERRRQLNRTRYRANRTYHCARRREMERSASPVWLTDEQKEQIKQFYKTAQHMSEFHEEPYEVDHIEPLIGKNSCGLGVPWNFRVIHWRENRAKSNKLINEL